MFQNYFLMTSRFWGVLPF